MNQDISLALASKPQIEQLMPAYLDEMALYTDVPLDADGHRIYPYLPHYWQEPDRTPYAILCGDEIRGFALIRNLTDPENGKRYCSMAEFYVELSVRRSGLGTAAARQTMLKQPGNWEVSVLLKNQPARKFWARLLTALDPSLTQVERGESISYELKVG